METTAYNCKNDRVNENVGEEVGDNREYGEYLYVSMGREIQAISHLIQGERERSQESIV